MQSNNRLLAAAVGLALTIAMMPEAQASPITYSFSVTAQSGPLQGTTASGTFTYDTSSIVPGGTNANTGLLTDLDFTWNGIAYNETTANTGALSFNGAGTLTNDLFGTNCSAGSCGVTPAQEQWNVAFPSFFQYSVQGGLIGSTGSGTITQSLAAVPAPKPSSLAVLGVVIAGLILAGARRRQRLA